MDQRAIDALLEVARTMRAHQEAADRRDAEHRRMLQEQQDVFREEREKRERKDEEARQEKHRPWLMSLIADASRNHDLSQATRAIKFNQHLTAAGRSQEAIIQEMYDIWGDDGDRAFLRSSSYLAWAEFCRAHNARLLKKRLDADINDAWANDWGPYARMACPILFFEAEQVCPAAADFNRSVLESRRAASGEHMPDPTGGAAVRDVPLVKAPWVERAVKQGKMRLRTARDPLGGEPTLQVFDAAGTVIWTVDLADVAAITREHARRTEILLDGTQQAHQRIEALERKMTQGQTTRARARSADSGAPRARNIVCFVCQERGHLARWCPKKKTQEARATVAAPDKTKQGTGF